MIQEYKLPGFQQFMKPILETAATMKKISVKDILTTVCEKLDIPEEHRHTLLPSGVRTKVRDRCEWAKVYLAKAGALKQTSLGCYAITPFGRRLLTEKEINLKTLQIKEKDSLPKDMTALELAVAAVQKQNTETEKQILDALVSKEPYDVEKIIRKLLERMHYGKVRHVGQPGDGGVDVIINEDELGVRQIYVQVKRYSQKNGVGSPDLQKFTGCMDQNHIHHGIFITTSYFLPSAEETAKASNKRVELVDGKKLAHLMQVYDLGAKTIAQITVKEFDPDAFCTE